MRIGIDATCWSNRRGFGRFARELLSAIAELNTGDEFVLLSDWQTAQKADFPTGWEVLVALTNVAPSQAAAADGRRSLRDMWAMRQLAMSRSFDLLFFPAVYSYFPVGGRVPCLVTFHDVIAETLPRLIFTNRRSRFFWNVKCRLAARRAARIVTVSEASKEGLMKVFRVPGERVRLVSEAPSPAFASRNGHSKPDASILQKLGFRADARFLLAVGGISPHKNLDTLIRAFGRVAVDENFADLRLMLVGDYRGDVFRTCHMELVSLARSLGVAERVDFPGYVPDDELAHLYAACSAFVFPSYLEGFGLPAVEAMACGAPVIASNRGSLPEVVSNAGLLFDPHDAVALAGCIRRLLVEPALRDEFRRRSLERAKQFSWERSARQAVDIFHEFRP